jgi:hypothetical protein
MLAILLLTALLVIRTGPETLLGRALHRPLVAWPAKKLAGLTRGRLILLAGFGLLIWAAVALIGEEAVRLMSMAMPDTLAWLATFDLSVLVDGLVAAGLIASQARLGRLGEGVRARLARRPRPRSRAPRVRRTRAPQPGNDDDPAGDWATGDWALAA